MSSPALERFLAGLYTDQPTLTAFIRSPAEIARAAGLSDAEVAALVDADHTGLIMAATSFRAKRERRKASRRPVYLPWHAMSSALGVTLRARDTWSGFRRLTRAFKNPPRPANRTWRV